MIVNQHSAVYDALRKQYTTKTALLLPNAPRYFILKRLRQKVTSVMRVWEAPTYYGEAEKLILDPLYQAAKASVANDAKDFSALITAYDLAAKYSLIGQVMETCVNKDSSRTIQNFATEASTFINALSPKKSDSGDGDKQSTVNAYKKVIDSLDDANALSILAEARRSPQENLTQIDPVWTTLTRYSGQGKGFALNRADSQDYMMKLNVIIQTIDRHITKASTELKSGDKSNFCHTDTAYVMMLWLLRYIEIIKDYDMYFPARTMVSQAVAFVGQIKQASYKLRSFYLELATEPIWLDLNIAKYRWNESHQFYKPVLEWVPTAEYKDLMTLWDLASASISKQSSSLASTAVSDVYDALKNYVSADLLLSKTEFEEYSDILSKIDLDENVPTGSQATEMNDISQPTIITNFDRTAMLVKLSTLAKAVDQTLAYAARLTQTLAIQDPDAIAMYSVFPKIEWGDKLDIGTIDKIETADFKYHDPLVPQYEKYAISLTEDKKQVASRVWSLENKINTVSYWIPTMLDLVSKRSCNSKLLWDGSSIVHTGDVLTTPYAQQPLPANYTNTRNREMISNTMDDYLTIMSGHYGMARGKSEFFSIAASIITSDTASYGRAMADNLAATMFIHAHVKNTDQWIWIPTSLPTIYGAPATFMKNLNTPTWMGGWLDGVSEIKATTLLKKVVVGTDYVTDRVAFVKTSFKYQQAKEAVDCDIIAFVLHSKVVSFQGEDFVVRIIAPYAQKTFLTVPISYSFWYGDGSADDDTPSTSSPMGQYNISNAAKADMIASVAHVANFWFDNKSKATKWEKEGKVQHIFGWAPFLITLPHALFDYIPTDTVVDVAEFKKYAAASLATKYDALLKVVQIQGFVERPMNWVTVADRANALGAADPTPLSNDAMSSDQVELPSDGKAPVASPSNPAPEPNSPAPEAWTPKAGAHQIDKTDEEAQVASITSAPITTGNDSKGAMTMRPASGDEELKMSLKDVSGKKTKPVLQGSAEPQEDEKPSHEPDGHVEKYWKKVEGGVVVDVVSAESAPDGYVPASVEDYIKFTNNNEAGEGASGDEKK